MRRFHLFIVLLVSGCTCNSDKPEHKGWPVEYIDAEINIQVRGWGDSILVQEASETWRDATVMIINKAKNDTTTKVVSGSLYTTCVYGHPASSFGYLVYNIATFPVSIMKYSGGYEDYNRFTIVVLMDGLEIKREYSYVEPSATTPTVNKCIDFYSTDTFPCSCGI